MKIKLSIVIPVYNEEEELVAAYHDRNRGKGAAIRSAIEKATGYLAVIQGREILKLCYPYGKEV